MKFKHLVIFCIIFCFCSMNLFANSKGTGTGKMFAKASMNFNKSNFHLKNIKSLLRQLASTGNLDTTTIIKFLHKTEKMTVIAPEESEKIAKHLLDLSIKANYNSGIMSASMLVGRLYQQKGNYSSSKTMAKRVIKLASKLGDSFMLRSANILLGNTYFAQNDYDQSLQYYFKAIKSSKVELTPSIPIAAAYINIASIMNWRGDHKTSLSYSKRALKMVQNLRARIYLPSALISVANSYHYLNNLDSAEFYLVRARVSASGIKDISNYNIASYNLASLYSGNNQPEKAIEIFEQQIASNPSPYYYSSLAPLLASCYIQTGKYNIAQGILDKALAIADTHDLIEDETYIYDAYCDLFTAKKQFDKALEYYKLHTNLCDSLNDSETKSAIDELNIKYETGRKELQIKQLHKDRQYSQDVALFAIIICSLMFISIFAVIFMLQKRSKYITQLTKINETLQATTIELEKANKDKNTILGVATHDLKNPLHCITLSTYLLKSQLKNLSESKISDVIANIENSSTRINNIISDLLMVHSLDNSAQFEIKQFNPIAVIESAVQVFNPQILQKDITLKYELPKEPITIRYAEQAFLEIFDNLLSNAIKFSPKFTQVTVIARLLEDGSFYVAVHDSGPGITKEDEKEIFGKFKQLSAKPTDGENSTGLGLSIAKELADKMHSELYFKPGIALGTEFYLIISKDNVILPEKTYLSAENSIYQQ